MRSLKNFMFDLELGHFFITRFRVLAGSFTQITENVFKTWFKHVFLAVLCVSAKTQLDRTNITYQPFDLFCTFAV